MESGPNVLLSLFPGMCLIPLSSDEAMVNYYPPLLPLQSSGGL